jgi:hypothetical protein
MSPTTVDGQPMSPQEMEREIRALRKQVHHREQQRAVLISIGSVIAINAAKRAGDEDHSLKFGIEITAGVIPGRYIDAP